MSEINTKKILSSFGRISKQWGLGESVGKVWGFLLFNSEPINQKEIEEGIGYSRGLISRSLKKLKGLEMVSITKKGSEFYYSTNASLIKGFNSVIKNFLEVEVKPLIETLSKESTKIDNNPVRKNFDKIVKEYKKLNLGISIFSKIMESFNLPNIKDLKEAAKKYSILKKEVNKNGSA